MKKIKKLIFNFLKKKKEKLLNLKYDEIEICKHCNASIYQYNKLWAKLQN